MAFEFNGSTISEWNGAAISEWNGVAIEAPPAGAWTLPDNEIDITTLITYGAAFNDVDLSTVVPAGTKLVLLHVRNTSADTAYACDTRMNGSSDAQSALELSPELHTTLIAALDGSLIFDGYFANAALAVGITAYSSSGAGLATRVMVGPTVSAAWTGKDISANVAAGSTAAFISITDQQVGRAYTVHKNGSSMDTNSAYSADPSHPGLVITGLTSGVFEYKVIGADPNESSCFLAAYDDQIIELADKLDVTPGVSGEWTDCDCSSVVPAGSIAALVVLQLIQYTGTPRQLNVRAKGSTDNIITDVKTSGSSTTTLVKLDSSRIFQGYTGLTGYAGIYVKGYIPGA